MLRLTRVRRPTSLLPIALVLLSGLYFYAVKPHHSSASVESSDDILHRADILAWENRWPEAKPLYAKASLQFKLQDRSSKELYATVSEIPADESVSLPANILKLTQQLSTPEAHDAETELRILTIRGMLEIDYDAAQARTTWQRVGSLALQLHHYQLATRAEGEQGIAAFLVGDTETAKRLVVRAWGLSKVERDPAATIRYASVFGAGLVQVQRYQEALTFLDQATQLAGAHPEVAYPAIAVYAKIDALAGLHRYDEARELADQSLERLNGTPFDGHRAQVYISRGSIERDQKQLRTAAEDYQEAVNISRRIDDYRGVTDAAGLLAQTDEQEGELSQALGAINAAIDANTRIPDELYLVPRNLAIKAAIVGKMGHAEQSEVLYQKSIALIDRMIQHASTANVQRQLLGEMSDVYSGYFALLCRHQRYSEALQILDNVRGRVEAESLQHHGARLVHAPTAEERELTRLNLSLINTDDQSTRASLTSAIYSAELGINSNTLSQQTITHPVHLKELQHLLGSHALLVEYVLAEPVSYAFAITRESVNAYSLPEKSIIEADATLYRKEIHGQRDDKPLAQKLFSELLQPIAEYENKTDLVIIPDGVLHLLPFSALEDSGRYVLQSHTVDINPSSTVYALLHKRSENNQAARMPYIGVAAWTQHADTRNLVVRAISGPERSQLVPLPASKDEVETIAQDLPNPRTILEGADATEGRFKSLPLDSTDVIHLALHGYADLDYPDRSALIFAPDTAGKDDGLLQVREIRELHLKAKLVTLSACNTGVGPVGEAGIVNLVNAFIEAGADSVVSTLWELEDHSTEHLMTDFYAQLRNHKRKVDALRTAQLALLNEGLSPYYWASFQIVGDPTGSL